MRFEILSLFPESFHSYFDVSILKRAQVAGRVEMVTHDLRDFTHDRHKTVDDTPYGGGAGMVMKVEPFAECLAELHRKGGNQYQAERTRTILFSAKGRRFTQADARRFAERYDRLILLCGRYEGVDERVAEHLVDEELSVGDFVLTGGELPAMIVTDAVTRLLPGVLGNEESAQTESHSQAGLVEYPQYTKPECFGDWCVPPVLLSGHHGAIEAWRREQSLLMSKRRGSVADSEVTSVAYEN
ncbi:MAG: tRNA (guanosine(37)-N1)-methyltransferase TrmD [Candidatus Moranbacteria bacterium]|nr:tRNA (guanosine(37)-N1)-methyltransferase TrmD [Candidatus Moranbacteria bacterium]